MNIDEKKVFPTFQDMVEQLETGNQESKNIAAFLQKELDKGNVEKRLSKWLNE